MADTGWRGDETIVLTFHGDTHAPHGWRSHAAVVRAQIDSATARWNTAVGRYPLEGELQVRLVRPEMFWILVAVRESATADEGDEGKDQVWDEDDDAEAC